jgi:hypothetical protein
MSQTVPALNDASSPARQQMGDVTSSIAIANTGSLVVAAPITATPAPARRTSLIRH